ncbi:MAG TPA: hypothetical protein EYP33_05950 [Pyrodictium sp.]|nr:hypothetical protein [Pyrodictium sp.]
MYGWLSRQFAALVLLATILVVLPGSGAAAQHWFEPIPLQPQLTRIYGMLGYVMPGEEGITAAAYVNGKGTLVVAGQGYVAGVDLESMSIVWRQSLIGTATTSSVYSPTADWVVVGSDSGEIVAINLDDPAVRADFYTAGREAVVSVYSMEFDGGLSIVAQDSLGALYLYALGEPGWLEFATEASNGAYKSYIVG